MKLPNTLRRRPSTVELKAELDRLNRELREHLDAMEALSRQQHQQLAKAFLDLTGIAPCDPTRY